MALLSELIQRLPLVKNTHMSSQGFSLWICWDGELDNAVPQALQDYGGMSVVTDRSQALWFFFSSDVFLALAKLTVWSKFHPLPISVQVFPSKLLLSVRREISLSIDPSLVTQEVLVPQSLEILVHPKAKEIAGIIPGITYTLSKDLQGMAPVKWENLEADPRLPYMSSQGWYVLIHPVGNPLDKLFQSGWRTMYEAIEKIIQANKFKYNLHNNYLMLSIDNLRQLRIWVRDILKCISDAKVQGTYWPCVCISIDKKGLNFTNDLPTKVGIKWDNLIPDVPYITYRNAFLLGEGFKITDLNFSSSHVSMDSWCTVELTEGSSFASEVIPILMPEKLVSGENSGCFYCGSKNHDNSQCVTRTMSLSIQNIWNDLAEMSVEVMSEGFQLIEQELKGDDVIVGYENILFKDNTLEQRLLKAIFEITLPLQVRSIRNIWLATGREFPKSGDVFSSKNNNVKDDSPAWGLLERFKKIQASELLSFEKDVLSASRNAPRDFRLRTLLGFIAVEKGDLSRAQLLWKEAESLASTGLHQVWHMFLQARLLEIQGRFSEAIEIYQNVLRLYPSWLDAEYRQIVCHVKMGFAEQVQTKIFQLIDQDPSFFNRFFIDPELDRGYLSILSELLSALEGKRRLASDEKIKTEKLLIELDEWFPKDYAIANTFRQKLKLVINNLSLNTYVAFLSIIQMRPIIENDITKQIKYEIKNLKQIFKIYLKQLEKIRDEAAWFPFPNILIEFNKNFNECANIFNWAFTSNFNDAEIFKKARGYAPLLQEYLEGLTQRLKFLRIVRDVTLFILILGKTFFWIEVIGLLLCATSIPLIAIFGSKVGLGWLSTLIKEEQWGLQRILLLIISSVAIGISAIHTTLVFERKRDQLIEEARLQREKIQQIRLKHISEAKKEKQKSIEKI